MRRPLLGLVVVLAALAAFVAWKKATGPFQAYRRFTEHVARMELAEALELAEGEATLSKVRSIASAAGHVPMEAFRGVRVTKKSERSLPGGEVELEVEELLAFDPPGAQSAMGGAVVARFDHVARLARRDGRWRVVSFERKFVKAVDARGRDV